MTYPSFTSARPTLLALAGVLLVSGCSSTTMSNTPRTSTEQLLVANAIDQSLNKVDFTSFAGEQVFLQDKYVDCVDKNYLIASTRHRLMVAGARLVDAADKASVVVELRHGAVGTASADSFIGTPEIALPGMLTIPEVRFVERKRQQAVAKVGLVAYDPQTLQILGTGGTSLARSDDSNWFVAGIGPYQNGAIRKEVLRSTTGSAATPRTQLPITVAFEPPPRSPDTQFAEDGVPPAPAVSPASHDSPARKLLDNPFLPW